MMNTIKKLKITLSMLFLTIAGFSQNLPLKKDLDEEIVRHRGYILSYNETCEQPNWVMYKVTKEELEMKVAKRKDNFQEDIDVKTKSATPEDYYKSGYDKGHLAPAATFVDNQIEMDESFLMSNMSPQDPNFNRGVWKKLEEYERKVAIEKDSVWVISGPILTKDLKTIGVSEVCVPESYYKIIYTKEFLMCFILKNKKSNEPIHTFQQNIDVVERMTGIDFMIK